MVFIAGVFAPAGQVKGLLGFGLPTIGMGLMALRMAPVEAAAILILPTFVTNVWQMALGPSLARIGRRLATMMLGICAGTWAGGGFMTAENARVGTVALGVALAAYAATSLKGLHVQVRPAAQPWVSPLVGAATGLLTAATGVSVMPAAPYLQGLRLDKEELIQALGLSFTVSTLALAVNIARAGAFDAASGLTSLVALASAIGGMLAGQALRRRMHPETFRVWFLAGLLGLGLYIAARAAS